MSAWSLNLPADKPNRDRGGLDAFWIDSLRQQQPPLEFAQKQIEPLTTSPSQEFAENQDNRIPHFTLQDLDEMDSPSLRSLLRDNDKQAEVIHFATHGSFDKQIAAAPLLVKLRARHATEVIHVATHGSFGKQIAAAPLLVKLRARHAVDSQSNGAFEVLASLYTIPNAAGVNKFLRHHRPLRGLLFDALPKIKSQFGNTVRPELLLIEDMEDDLQRLRVTITSNRGDASQALERFDEDWWLDHIQFSQGLLNFTLRTE
jgi:hypothetical protein